MDDLIHWFQSDFCPDSKITYIVKASISNTTCLICLKEASEDKDINDFYKKKAFDRLRQFTYNKDFETLIKD